MDDLKIIFKEAVRLNHLTVSDLVLITGDSPRAIESWLYDSNRNPSWRATYLLYLALFHAKGKIPRDLGRNVVRYKSRAWRWGKKNPLSEKLQFVGEKRFERGAYRYIYQGETLTVRELSEATGISLSSMYYLMKNCSPGDDVTVIIDGRLSQHDKQRHPK